MYFEVANEENVKMWTLLQMEQAETYSTSGWAVERWPSPAAIYTWPNEYS